MAEEVQKNTRIHICRFDSADHLRGKQRTYEALKAAVLEAGRFSVFEASESPASFTRLEHDPEVEVSRDSMAFPWIGVQRKAVP